MNGFAKDKTDSESFSEYRRRYYADRELKQAGSCP
jgi:hypothetical protein